MPNFVATDLSVDGNASGTARMQSPLAQRAREKPLEPLPQLHDKELTAVYDQLGLLIDWQYEWRHALEAIRDASKPDQPIDKDALNDKIVNGRLLLDKVPPSSSCDHIVKSEYFGGHFEQFKFQLELVEKHWPRTALHGGEKETDEQILKANRSAKASLDALFDARRQLAFIVMCKRVDEARWCEAIVLTDELQVLNQGRPPSEQVDPHMIASWMARERPHFNGRELACKVELAQARVYRLPRNSWAWAFTVGMPIISPVIGLAVLALFLILLDRSGVQKWPTEPWHSQFVLLFVCVNLGAGLHIGKDWLSNVNFEGHMEVYGTTKIRVWLSLHWVAIMRLFVPIIFVTGVLWVSGTVPTSIEDVTLAVLSGYSADSLFRAAMTRLDSDSSKLAGAPPAAAPAENAAPQPGQPAA